MPLVSLRVLLKSFRYALKGVNYAWKYEQNFRIHVVTATAVVILMFLLPLLTWERILLLLIITLILVLELVNTTTEKIIDILRPRIHSYAEVIKDLMAAAVFFASLGAVVIGLYIFVPYILDLFWGA